MSPRCDQVKPNASKSQSLPGGSVPQDMDETATSGTTKAIAYIAVGSNLGRRTRWIELALKEMKSRGIKILRTSSLWETAPMYVTDQDLFLNGVVEVCLLTSNMYKL